MCSACTCHIDAEACNWCKLEGINERANKATIGPWKWKEPDDNSCSTEMPMILNDSGELILNFGDSEQYYPTEGVPPDEKDAQFIIQAREDIPFLLDYIKKQQQEIEQFKTVVKSLSFALEAYSGMPAEKAMNELIDIAKSLDN
ncbi:hypothetical protein ACUXCC_003460 [Cytobacillus horneckiae]|uniref:hypothetical protein n=1 Tax=Cytobacillus horneckiae TaxID=549687 RepID=UPI0019D1B168|nr:hypothetical protein [Cytobacillus horneckiae]MBN6889916.1 hypothetical protein [Cytobacillus horneckiae]